MTKILSQSGNSLADLYDVQGSIAGIDQLETRELPIMHEMGATVFSERLSGFVRRGTSGAIAQNTNFDVVLSDLPFGISRILSVQVICDTVSNITDVCVVQRTAATEQDLPIWTGGPSLPLAAQRVRFEVAGAGVAYHDVLTPQVYALPSLVIGEGQPQQVSQIAMRGLTAAFGAGTVTIQMLVYLALSHVGGGSISNRGLPVPGW